MGSSLSEIINAGLYATPNTGWLEAIVKGAEAVPAYYDSKNKAIQNQQTIENNDLKNNKLRMDYYRTLRESGYDSASAYEMSLKHYKMPKPTGEMAPNKGSGMSWPDIERATTFAGMSDEDFGELGMATQKPGTGRTITPAGALSGAKQSLKVDAEFNVSPEAKSLRDFSRAKLRTLNSGAMSGGGSGNELSAADQYALSQVKTAEDLQDLIDDAEAGRIPDVNIEAIKQYLQQVQ